MNELLYAVKHGCYKPNICFCEHRLKHGLNWEDAKGRHYFWPPTISSLYSYFEYLKKVEVKDPILL